jgi:hypothetical protein
VKLSRGRSDAVQKISSNFHREQESNCTFPSHELQGGQAECEEEERSNYEHPNEGDGRIHGKDRKAASGDTNEELLGDEGEEGGSSEEFARVKEWEEQVLVPEGPDTESMEEEGEDGDGDGGDEEQKHLRRVVGREEETEQKDQQHVADGNKEGKTYDGDSSQCC